MLFLHLLNGTNSFAKTSKSGEFLLDFLQPLLSLAVGKVGMRVRSGLTAILCVQFLKLCDFGPKAGNLFAKNFEVIHCLKNSIQIGHQSFQSNALVSDSVLAL